MRAHIASILLLIVGGAAACGEVEDGECPGAEQSDNIACTLDVCNAEAGGWAHIPNNNLCEAGQACSPTAGCVAAGALTGTATLYGMTDHSGITVTVEGIEGATATTDAMGNWTIVVPPATYAVTYTKDKYMTQREPNIVVLAEAAERAPDVELMHGELKDGDRIVTTSYSYTLNPDRSFIIEMVPSAVGTSYYATPTDGSKTATLIASNPGNVYYTNTHMVWVTTTGGTTNVWSRPLTGASQAVLLGVVGPGTSMSIVGTPGAYTLMLRTTAGISSIWVAKTDGSVIHATAAWTQSDGNHPLGVFYPAFTTGVTFNDTHALIGTNNYTGSPPADTVANTPFVRVDLATNAATLINIGFPTNNVYFISASPDRNYVFGWVISSSWIRGFMAPVSGTSAPALAPSYGAGSSQYSDFTTTYPTYWLPDSTGVVYQTVAYTLSGGGTAQGDLRVWMTASAASAVIASPNPQGYNFGGGGQRLLGKNFIYADGSAPSRILKVAAVSANPTSYNLDTTGYAVLNMWSSPDGSYLVWDQAESSAGSTHTKILSVPLATPLTAAPTVTQLGANTPAGCSFEAFLAGTTFFRFCNDTRTVQAFEKSSSTATGTADNVVGNKWRFDKSNRMGFRRGDGKLYSLGTDLKVIANTIDPDSTPVTSYAADFPGTANLYSDWIFYRDGTSLMTRASRADGSVLDEPILPCDVSSFYVSESSGNDHIFLPSTRCQTLDYRIAHVPSANMP